MNEIRARVISQEKGLYRISNGSEEKLAEVTGRFRHDTQTVSDYPGVGDYVIATWPEDESNASITMLFPRKSCIIRKAAGTDRQEQVVAANVDSLFVCMSLNNDFNLRRLERYLAIAWESGATPVVLLTKADLCDDVQSKVIEVERIAIGVDVLTVASLDGDYNAVLPYIQEGRTVAFIGSSGVGKSTLINRLLGEDVIATNGLRNDDKGRHTTTHRQLIELPCGAYVIDTPGMRELGMWDSKSGIETTFADIEELSESCRFADCTHTGEPGCAVMAAIGDGTLTRERWNSYLKLKMENEYAADGSSYLRAKEEKFKQIAKVNRKNKKR